jgi:23S rRNA maturation mini-RNase III
MPGYGTTVVRIAVVALAYLFDSTFSTVVQSHYTVPLMGLAARIKKIHP